MIRSCSSSNVLLTNGWPSTISETSVEVPPTSAQSRFPSPIASPRRALEIVPAAGPAKTMRNGCSSASAHGSSVAAQSAKLRSPVKPSCAQLGVELVRVLREDALHEDIDDRRRCACVLLGERRGVGGDRNGDVAEHLADELAEALLVGGVDVRVEQADRHPFDVAPLEDRELACAPASRPAASSRCRRPGSAPRCLAAGSGGRAGSPRHRTSGASSGRSARRAGARRDRGRACRGIPSVVRNAIFGRRRVMTALIPIVLAWLNTVLPSTPSRRAPSTTAPQAGRGRSAPWSPRCGRP